MRSESDAVSLSWPATGTTFTLEGKDAVHAATWSEVAQSPAVLDFELVSRKPFPNSVSSSASAGAECSFAGCWLELICRGFTRSPFLATYV
jgi:hypothetical protein